MPWHRVRAQITAQPPAPVAPVTPEAPVAACTPTPNAWPLRNPRLPQCYHNGDAEQDSDIGEYIDIHGNSDGTSDDSQLEQGPQHTTSPTTTAINTATTDPLATGQSSQSRPIWKAKNVAYDICHFFRREKERTTCLPCEWVCLFYWSLWLGVTDTYYMDNLGNLH